MGLFRRKPRPERQVEPSLEEIENSPEYLAAQEAVNRGPITAPSGSPYLNTMLGDQVGIVVVPDEGDDQGEGDAQGENNSDEEPAEQ